ncbi:unnamed protein product [Notodromas monacha]|uniref:Uncharacterized protein n=1 Tax=Notodromas monacha TaxID=399045 RepID=A0A7R9GD12_9CRUS|nr:unnamed protein product [Notodromas monacha]CAG0918218.1 unnamed protein product [Notodromas monacha]
MGIHALESSFEAFKRAAKCYAVYCCFVQLMQFCWEVDEFPILLTSHPYFKVIKIQLSIFQVCLMHCKP